MIQKLEGDVRNHIRVQHQLRMHIDGLQEQLTELSKSNESQAKHLDRYKKERRRMEELVTLKEGQVDNLEAEVRDLHHRTQ
jgi:chromosome segregation ATPase